jgi:hypothetical protein
MGRFAEPVAGRVAVVRNRKRSPPNRPSSGHVLVKIHRMRRHRRRAVVLASAIAAGLLVSSGTAYASTAPAGPFDPPVFWGKCTTDMHWPGTNGVINAQLGPTGFIQWNIVDYTDNGGRWWGDVFVGKRRVDHKDQNYNPHGSVSNVDARSGYLFHITMNHIDLQGRESVSDPGAGCIVP